MPQGLSAHRPTAYQARPGGRPVSRQTGPSAQKNIPASLLEGPSAAGSAAHPRAEAADGSRMVPWFRCNRCTPSPRRLHPVGALVAPRSGSGCICCTPMRQLSTASPTVAAGPGPGSAPKRSPRRSPDAAPQRCCPGAGRLASCLSFCLIHPRPGPFTSVRSDRVCAVRGPWRTPVNAGQHCWKACWLNPRKLKSCISALSSPSPSRTSSDRNVGHHGASGQGILPALSSARTRSMPTCPSTPRSADTRSWLRRTSPAWRVKASPKRGIAASRLPVP